MKEWINIAVVPGDLSAPGSMEVAGWIGCLFFLVAGWNQLEKFLDRRANRVEPRHITPQPLAITQQDHPVPESLCRQRHAETRQAIAHLEQEFNRLRLERREEESALRQTIAKVDREVGELKASLELSNRHLVRIDAKLDRVFEHKA